jgi:hypothetical protein
MFRRSDQTTDWLPIGEMAMQMLFLQRRLHAEIERAKRRQP